MNYQKLKSEARKIGATITRIYGGRTVTILADTPDGQVWDACDLHCLVADYYRQDKKGEQEAIADIYDRMAYGMSRCEGEDCEYCHNHVW